MILTYDPQVSGQMWLMADYLPEVAELDLEIFPSTDDLAAWLGGGRTEIHTVEIPCDTPDWMLGSFWAHPERVLDPQARNATSGFARIDDRIVDRVVNTLAADLRNGRWDQRHGHLRQLDALDVGLRLIVNHPTEGAAVATRSAGRGGAGAVRRRAGPGRTRRPARC